MRYDEVELGDDLPTETPDVSLERVKRFVQAANMDFPRFTDSEQARREGLPGAIMPGIMGMGLIAAMIHRWAPGCRILKLDTVFRSPVLVGSQPRCTGAVTDTNDDTSTVEVDVTVVADNGQTCIVGTATVAFADVPASPPPRPPS